MTLGHSFPAAIKTEVRLQSTGQRVRGEATETVRSDPSMEKLDLEGSKKRWLQEEGNIRQIDSENSESSCYI